MPRNRDDQDLPRTLKRSPEKAQRTWQATHDSAVEAYGDGEHAHRVAFAALKHTFEKVGDHWEPKDHPGSSDPRAREGGQAAREGKGETFGGVDMYGHTKAELARRARDLGVPVKSRMTKTDLARAIDKRQS